MRPKKIFGQNFLNSPKVFEFVKENFLSLVEDKIFEVGMGPANFTKFFLENEKKVYGIDIDKDFLPIYGELKNEYKTKFFPAIIDVRNVKIPSIPFFSNMPYYLSKLIVQKLFFTKGWKIACICMQVEVADRLITKIGRDFSLLSILFNLRAKLLDSLFIKSTLFFPPPKVDSKMLIFQEVDFNLKKLKEIFNFSKILFNNRRKKIVNKFSKTDRELIPSKYLNKRIEEIGLEGVLEIYHEFEKKRINDS